MERNACVDCRYFLQDVMDVLVASMCTHPAHVTMRFNRVFGEHGDYRTCCSIRSEQPTDACPHWKAKPEGQ